MLAKTKIPAILRKVEKTWNPIPGGRFKTFQLFLNPFPDYWSSLLHKRLVGRRVLEVRRASHFVEKSEYTHIVRRKNKFIQEEVLFS